MGVVTLVDSGDFRRKTRINFRSWATLWDLQQYHKKLCCYATTGKQLHWPGPACTEEAADYLCFGSTDDVLGDSKI